MALSLRAFPVMRGAAELAFENSFAYPRGALMHDAIDIIGPSGMIIVSTTPGRVVSQCVLGGERRPGAGTSPRGGNYVVIVDDAGNFHYYAHMQSPPIVFPGSPVVPYLMFGFLGDSGIARGCPHLHYQVWGPFTGENSQEQYQRNEFTMRFRNPINPYSELVRLASAMGATHNPGGRYFIPPLGRAR